MIAVHRRADLVAHVGEELRLRLRRLLRFRLGAVELAHQLCQARGIFAFRRACDLEVARVRRELFVGDLRVGDVAGLRVDGSLLDVRHRRPGEPAVRSVGGPIAIVEPKDVVAAADPIRRLHRRLAIVRVHELEIRRGAELSRREPQDALPRRVETLEVAVETGDTEHVLRQHEEAIELLLGPPALHELADLTANRAEHLQQFRIGLADLATEELHHA